MLQNIYPYVGHKTGGVLPLALHKQAGRVDRRINVQISPVHRHSVPQGRLGVLHGPVQGDVGHWASGGKAVLRRQGTQAMDGLEALHLDAQRLEVECSLGV